MIVVPYQELENFSDAPIATGGTYTYISGPDPGPTPPAWNGIMNFFGFAEGIYVYRYTLDCGIFADLTIEHFLPPDAPNDECDDASTLPLTGLNGFYRLIGQQSGVECPITGGATASADASPWPGGPYKDLWYVANLNLPSTGLTIRVDIDGTPYGSGGIYEPRIAFYSDCAGTLLASANPTFSSFFNTLTYTLTSNVSTFIVRVASTSGGKFDLEIDA